MRFATYRNGRSAWASAVQIGTDLFDTAALARLGGMASAAAWSDPMRPVVSNRDERARLQEAAWRAVPLAEDTPLGPPVPAPAKILCIGHNYVAHVREVGKTAPAAPVIFAKFATSLIGPGDEIPNPPATSELDYEGELAVVIGARVKDVAEDAALASVAGYMCLNDISARDLQRATSQWTAGKALDGFAPCGPWLVLAEDVPDPQALTVTTRVNAAVRQEASTAQMIFPVARLISYISGLMTLEPGDIIATGTPAGVGMSMDPPGYLHAGDRVEVEIAGLGVLSNRVAARG
jgi:acylpyruvate hydrolase